MDMKGTHTFSANPQAVWDALHNSAILQKCIPGAEEVAWRGEDAIFARVAVNMGPVKGNYGAEVQVVEHTAPSHMRAAFNRSGSLGSIQGTADVDLAAEGAGTQLTYNVHAALGGTLAMADNPLVRPMIESQLNQFFVRLNSQLS